MALSEEGARELCQAWNALIAPLERLKAVETKQRRERSFWAEFALQRVRRELARLAKFALPIPGGQRDSESEPDTLVDHVNHSARAVSGESRSAVAPDGSHPMRTAALATNPLVHTDVLGLGNRTNKGTK